MEHKILNYNGRQFSLRISSYCDNERIAIAMYEIWDDHHEAWGTATKNLDEYLFGPNDAFMDEENNPGITKCFIESGLATFISNIDHCGTMYPVVELNLEEIKKYDHIPSNENEEEWDDIEREDADDSEDVDALFRELLGVEEDE